MKWIISIFLQVVLDMAIKFGKKKYQEYKDKEVIKKVMEKIENEDHSGAASDIAASL